MISRAQAWAHIKTNLLEIINSDDPLELVFQAYGIKSFANINTLTDVNLGNLKYKDPTDPSKMIPLSLPLRAKLRVLRASQAHWCHVNASTSLDWTSVTIDDFDLFRSVHYDPNAPILPFWSHQAKPDPTLSSGIRGGPKPPSNVVTPGSSKADLFKKSIKREKSHYKPFKTERDWDN